MASEVRVSVVVLVGVLNEERRCFRDLEDEGIGGVFERGDTERFETMLYISGEEEVNC